MKISIQTLHNYSASTIAEAIEAIARNDDFARRALSDESVVEIVLPTVEEALALPEQTAALLRDAENYGADEYEIQELREKIESPYKISDGMVVKYAATIPEAVSIVRDSYDHLANDNENPIDVPAVDLADVTDLDDLNARIAEWEEEIAQEMGYKDFAGHGTYYITAAARAGLQLRVEIRE